MKKEAFIFIIFLNAYFSFSQKFNFVNWSVEDGLIQSQASYICQDKYRQLWISTEGGVSRFDGKRFTGYTVQDGLVANHINTMFCDITGNLWLGSNFGISVFNGRDFKTIKPLESPINNVSEILQLKSGEIYALDNYKLIEIKEPTCKKLNISKDTSERITALLLSKTNDLLASVYKKGIYLFKNHEWTQVYKLPESKSSLYIRSLFVTASNDTLACTNKGLQHLLNNQFIPYQINATTFPEINIFCVAEDNKGNLWLGTENGCYRFSENTVMHFNEKSGFTDNSVNHIYNDVENNLWFATNGGGIYKFRENTFSYYDKSSGIPNTIVMGVVETKDKTIYAAGYGGGLYKINEANDIESIIIKGKTLLADSKINCLYADSKNNVWIGTLNKGAFQYNAQSGLKKIESKNNTTINIRGATVFLEDKHGNMLIGSNQGLYLQVKNEELSQVKIPANLITSLKQFDTDHILVGTSKGIYLLDENYNVAPFHEKLFGDASVLCLYINKNSLWIGTTDKGVLNWNFNTGKIITYTTHDGLPSNFIYSIDVSDSHKAWIGTGFGISNLQLNDTGKVLAIKNYGRSDGLIGMECNHNCLLKASDSSLWFGTTKGLFHFNPNTKIVEKNQPFVLLRSVKLFSSPITDSTLYQKAGAWFNAPDGLSLSSRQNHLTFELGAIYFTNPEDVLYKYKLEGIDKDFTITNNPYIIYPALPPGKYTLKVTGLTKGGSVSFNEINYVFEIKKAFYQTRLFQLIGILLLLATGALLAYIFTRGKQKRKQKAKELLEKIREEEFMKLRQRTAEDFHDEMGNSLTRISVLTDILKSKINGKEQEITHLVTQIKDNTKALYNGSKDIIWSLNSQNDDLYKILERIKDIGNELFQETAIDFNYTHLIDARKELKLKLDYSRNLTMIFKEVYSNILKHSQANSVHVFIKLNNESDLSIEIKDNGIGFTSDPLWSGNGLKNIKNRATRMNGTVSWDSQLNSGTKLTFILKNIFI